MSREVGDEGRFVIFRSLHSFRVDGRNEIIFDRYWNASELGTWKINKKDDWFEEIVE